ncbi:B3 domain-containing protein, partial [Trifolium pratense]
RYHSIRGGWIDFVRGNGIKVGNVCIFELMRENELSVRIAEVGKDGLDIQDEKLDFSVPSARQDVRKRRQWRG